LGSQELTMTKTNFDVYLEEQLADAAFAERFRQAAAEWDVALQISTLRAMRGLSQAELAKAVGTTQQVISRLESPGYSQHTRTTIDKVARALGARVEIRIVPELPPKVMSARERAAAKLIPKEATSRRQATKASSGSKSAVAKS